MSRTSTNQLSAIEVKLELTLHAPQARVWAALVDETTAWWPKAFYATSSAKRFTIEPRLGGKVGEDAGNGEGLVWYTVIGVERPNLLLLSGHLVPPFAGPATSYLRLALSSAGDGATKLELTDSCFGQLADCDTESGWRQIFDEALRQHVEASPAPKKPETPAKKKKSK
jgi:uncharacterized protein YndB with AHSA1/START domain